MIRLMHLNSNTRFYNMRDLDRARRVLKKKQTLLTANSFHAFECYGKMLEFDRFRISEKFPEHASIVLYNFPYSNKQKESYKHKNC